MPDPLNEKIPSGDPEKLLDQVLSKNPDSLLPWEDCQLPSRGVYYGGAIPEGMIKVRPMGITVDKILATQRLARSGQALDMIFRHCVQLPNGFDHLDLLDGDRSFLLYYLRGVTHGNEYEFMVKCTDPNCGQTSIQEYDLNQLYETARGPDPELGAEPFIVKLPFLSRELGTDFWVKIRYLRGRDTLAMLGSRQAQKQKMGPRNYIPQDEYEGAVKREGETLNQTLERNLNLVIEEAMGSRNRDKIKQLVDRLHSSDVAVIRDILNKAPGINTLIETDCEECGQTMLIDLPITDQFFRPKKS
jgi:hypothetical protein